MKSRGSISMEFIIALGLASLLFTLATPSVVSMARSYMEVKQACERLSAEIRFRELMQSTLNTLDKHRFWLVPRSQSILTFSDGTRNPIMYSNALSAPAPDSDFVTSILLDTESLFEVESSDSAPPTFNGRACKLLDSRVTSSQKAHYLGLGATDLFELIGTSSRISNNCLDFSLLRTKSMFIPALAQSTDYRPLLLVPIESLQTLYVDKQQQLRILRHRGDENIENQPMLSGIKRLKVLVTTNSDMLVHIEARLMFVGEREVTFQGFNRLSREDPMNLVLNVR